MGVSNFEYGDDQIGYVKLESSYGTAVKPAATDAFRALSMSMGYVPNRPLVADRRGTRSQMERIEGRHSATWAVTVLFRPSGSLGVTPDFADLLEMTFGTETVTPDTSVVYTPLKDMTGLFATIYRDLTTMHEFVYGAIVQNCRISWRGNDLITLAFSGVAKSFGETGTTTSASQQSNTVTLTLADADFLSKYSIVQIGTQTNAGAGYQITAAPNFTSEVVTLEAATTWASGASVTPFLPTASFTGSPVYGKKGSLSLTGDSTTVNFLGGWVNFATGLDLLNEEVGSENPTDVIMTGRRGVTMQLDFLARKDETYYMSHFRRKTSKDIRVLLGDTAGSIMQIDADNVEIDPAVREVPETGLIRVSLPGVGLGTSGEDEATLTLV